MIQPVYLTPQYINYAMIRATLTNNNTGNNTTGLIIVKEFDDDSPGMFIGQVNDYMAQGESYIIQTVLSNYVEIPLITIKNGDFASMVDNPQWLQLTYTPLINLFKSSALIQIYMNYWGTGGESSNGAELISQMKKQINFYTGMLLRLDQSGNMMYKNSFVGLKPCINANNQIGRQARVANGIPTGQDTASQVFRAIPQYRWVK